MLQIDVLARVQLDEVPGLLLAVLHDGAGCFAAATAALLAVLQRDPRLGGLLASLRRDGGGGGRSAC